MSVFVYDKELKKVVPIEESTNFIVNAPYVIEDSMKPIESQADGKMYDSKRAYYQSLRNQGYEIVGNEYKDPEKRIRKKDTSSANYKRYKQGIRTALIKTCKDMGIDL